MLWRAAIGAACHFLLSFVGVLILMNFKSDGEELLGGVKTIQDVTAALCLFLVPKVVHVSISLRDDLPFIYIYRSCRMRERASKTNNSGCSV